jgi:hypothetical protein
MSCVWKKRLGKVTEGVRVSAGKASREESRVSGGGADDPWPELQAISLTRRLTFVQSKLQRRRKLYPYAHFYWFIEYIELDSHSCSALVFGRMETDLTWPTGFLDHHRPRHEVASISGFPDCSQSLRLNNLQLFYFYVTCLWRHRTRMTNENRPRLATLLFEELWNFKEAALQRELAYAEHDDARNWHH